MDRPPDCRRIGCPSPQRLDTRRPKASNIHVSSSGAVTLLDLGFALKAWGKRLAGISRPTGHPRHMAPEVLTSASAASPTSDLYSLGVILFEMLTGRVPFEVNDPAELALSGWGQGLSPPKVQSTRCASSTGSACPPAFGREIPSAGHIAPKRSSTSLSTWRLNSWAGLWPHRHVKGDRSGKAQDSERSGIELSVDLRRQSVCR